MIVMADMGHIGKIAEIESASFSDPWSEVSLESALDGEMNIFLADISDNEVRGYIIGSCDGASGYIERIAVCPQLRRSGIASALMWEFERYLPDTAQSVSLEVRASNLPAVSLYVSLGFERAWLRRGMYSSPKEDGIVMIKRMI